MIVPLCRRCGGDRDLLWFGSPTGKREPAPNALLLGLRGGGLRGFALNFGALWCRLDRQQSHSSANGETRNPGGISSSRLLATSRRTRQQSAAGCKQPTSQLGYQEATSFMRTSQRRVHDAMLRRRPGRRFSYNGKPAKISANAQQSACIPEWGGLCADRDLD